MMNIEHSPWHFWLQLLNYLTGQMWFQFILLSFELLGLYLAYIEIQNSEKARSFERRIEELYKELNQIWKGLPDYKKVRRKVDRKLRSHDGIEILFFVAFLITFVIPIFFFASVWVTLTITILTAIFHEHVVEFLTGLLVIVILVILAVIRFGIYIYVFIQITFIFSPYCVLRFLQNWRPGRAIGTLGIIIAFLGFLLDFVQFIIAFILNYLR